MSIGDFRPKLCKDHVTVFVISHDKLHLPLLNPNMSQSKIRILIADEHVVVRRGIALLLNQEPDFEVVGDADNGVDAYNRIFDLVPDVVLLEYKMPRWDGFETARNIRRDMASTRIIILTGFPIDDTVLDHLNEVHGYLLKQISPAHLVHAIRAVVSGQQYFGPRVTQALLRSRQTVTVQPPTLSPRELEVLRLMATPATYREIAIELILAESTVHTYVRRILKKLGQSKRTQAVLKAMEYGLL